MKPEVFGTDAWLKEQEEQDRYLKGQEAQAEIEAKAWREKWPDACARCHGAGAFYSGGNYWQPPDVDICPRLENDETRTCCRCGQPDALDEDLNGPCRHCGWDYDDREPSFW
jgi:hypothetical protein